MLALAGCGHERQAAAEPEFERHWPGHIAVSDEFGITADFPADQPVCVSDSGTHIHGFHQSRDGDCAEGPGSRFLSVWADHNAMDWDGDRAVAEACGPNTERLDLDLQPTAGGRLDACLLKEGTDAGAGPYTVVAVYVPSSDADRLPDIIYTVRMGTTPEGEEADLRALQTFFAGLILAGSSFQPAAS